MEFFILSCLLPGLLVSGFLATFCWNLNSKMEKGDYEEAEKQIFSVAMTTSLYAFVCLIIFGYEFVKYLITVIF
jgi:hypothetical protein